MYVCMYVCMYVYIYIYVCFVVFLLSSNKSHELNIQISKAFYKNQSRFDASCWSSSLTGSSPTFVHKGLLRLVANVDFAVHQILKPRSSQGDVRQASVEVTPFFWDSRIPGYINSLHWFLSNHYHSSTVFLTFLFILPVFFCGLTNLQEKKQSVGGHGISHDAQRQRTRMWQSESVPRIPRIPYTHEPPW